MEPRADRVEEIIACALFLRDPILQEKEVWRKFTARFFKEYRMLILDYFRLGHTPDEQTPIRLNDREAFLAVISVLADREVFDCSKKVLAQAIYDRFELNLKLTSLVQYISQNNSENDDILHCLTNRKK